MNSGQDEMENEHQSNNDYYNNNHQNLTSSSAGLSNRSKRKSNVYLNIYYSSLFIKNLIFE
jgi:hypothetical protein